MKVFKIIFEVLFKELLHRKQDIWRKWLESGVESATRFGAMWVLRREPGARSPPDRRQQFSPGENTLRCSAVIYETRGHSLCAACFPSGEKEVLRARSSQSKDKHRGGGRDKGTGTTRGELSNWCVHVGLIRWRQWCRSAGRKDGVPRACWITQDNQTRHWRLRVRTRGGSLWECEGGLGRNKAPGAGEGC